MDIPFGRAGAPGMLVGVVPGTAVESKGSVAELCWLETITDNGTAVGLVASNENDAVVGKDGGPVVVAAPVVEPVAGPVAAPVAVPVAVPVADVGAAANVAGLGVAWRASRGLWRA